MSLDNLIEKMDAEVAKRKVQALRVCAEALETIPPIDRILVMNALNELYGRHTLSEINISELKPASEQP